MLVAELLTPHPQSPLQNGEGSNDEGFIRYRTLPFGEGTGGAGR
jgi:hypothetical protein